MARDPADIAQDQGRDGLTRSFDASKPYRGNGVATRSCSAVFVSCEDDNDELHYRIEKLQAHEPTAKVNIPRQSRGLY
jgi:hypothetical protein